MVVKMSNEEAWYENFLKNSKQNTCSPSEKVRRYNEQLENEWFNDNEENLRNERKKEISKILLDMSKKYVYH